jgi:hypothetical protein
VDLLPLLSSLQLPDLETLVRDCKQLSDKVQELLGKGGQGENILSELEKAMRHMLDLACETGCNSSPSSSQERGGTEELLNAVCEVEQHLSNAVAWLYKGSSMATDVSSALKHTARVLHSMQEKMCSLEEELHWRDALAGEE